MESQYEEISRWKNFCLENTCSWLGKKFPNAAVWIVRPSKMLRLLFSCFHNFVSSTITGVPEYDTTHGAIPHLEHLLRDAILQVHARGGLEKSVSDLATLPVTVIGFSKGCVVLNQILHELPNYVVSPKGNPDGSRSPSASPKLSMHNVKAMREFILRIKAFYWLDGGHSGDHGAWITDDELLKTLASSKAEIHVHVTPHQVFDPHRPWIGEEKCEFVAKLGHFGATVKDTIHFEHEEATLEKHFMVLEVF